MRAGLHGGAGCPFQLRRLRYDSTFATEVAYCHEKGIPHSEYLARWSNEDRAKVVAYSIHKGGQCSLCGTHEYMWVEDPYAYEAIKKYCPGCARKDAVANDDQQTPGTHVVLVPKEEAARLRANPGKKIGGRRRRDTAG